MPGLDYQVKIMREAKRRKLDLEEVADALSIDRCDCCGAPLDGEIRRVLR